MKADYHYLTSILVVAGVTALLFFIRRMLFRFFHRLAQKTSSQIDDLMLEGLKMPSTVLILTLALYVSIRLSELPQAYLSYVEKGLYLSLILTVTMGLANVSGRLIAYFLKRVDMPISVTSLLHALARAIVYAVGFLMMLNAVGVSITPIITALGVGGLAMALALQDTLSNLFAGIHILAEHTIRIGDYIRLETGQEGFVEDISWRTTRIRMPANNLVIVPNSKLSQSVVTNCSLPDLRVVATVAVSVGYDAEPDLVERVLMEEADRATQEVDGLLREPGPTVRFVPGFGASSLDFTLICHVREFKDQQLVLHELYKRILRRFRHEKIEIPYPTRTVFMKNKAPEQRP